MNDELIEINFSIKRQRRKRLHNDSLAHFKMVMKSSDIVYSDPGDPYQFEPEKFKRKIEELRLQVMAQNPSILGVPV